MRLIVSVEIDRPQAELIPLLANPATAKDWMDDLEAYKPLYGTPGVPGFTVQLRFGGKHPLDFTATTLASNSPDEVRSTLDSPMVLIQATGRFEAITVKRTRYISEQTFQFKGMANKIVGFLMRGAVKKQQQRHANGFKQFAERQNQT